LLKAEEERWHGIVRARQLSFDYNEHKRFGEARHTHQEPG
jgi:hypothetical protein